MTISYHQLCPTEETLCKDVEHFELSLVLDDLYGYIHCDVSEFKIYDMSIVLEN